MLSGHGVRRLVLFPFGEEGFVMRNWFLFALVGVFALVSMVVGSGEVLAQSPPEMVQFEPIVEWDAIFDTIRLSIGPVVVGALALGLAIWGARYVFSIIKSMGR